MKKHSMMMCIAALALTMAAPFVRAAEPGMPTGHAMQTMHHDMYGDAMKTMHEAMAVEPTGDADVDFVRGMIPHHQGAIDMAKIVLAQGKDPEIRKLAEGIIKAQESEIAWMKAWLEKHPAQ